MITEKMEPTRRKVIGGKAREGYVGIEALVDVDRSDRPRRIDHREIVDTMLRSLAACDH